MAPRSSLLLGCGWLLVAAAVAAAPRAAATAATASVGDEQGLLTALSDDRVAHIHLNSSILLTHAFWDAVGTITVAAPRAITIGPAPQVQAAEGPLVNSTTAPVSIDFAYVYGKVFLGPNATLTLQHLAVRRCAVGVSISFVKGPGLVR